MHRRSRPLCNPWTCWFRLDKLHVSLSELLVRIPDMETRGIAMKPDQTFEDLFEERNALYHKYADLTIECDQQNVQETLVTILKSL